MKKLHHRNRRKKYFARLKIIKRMYEKTGKDMFLPKIDKKNIFAQQLFSYSQGPYIDVDVNVLL